jgi:hypothetical protein
MAFHCDTATLLLSFFVFLFTSFLAAFSAHQLTLPFTCDFMLDVLSVFVLSPYF